MFLGVEIWLSKNPTGLDSHAGVKKMEGAVKKYTSVKVTKIL